MTREFPFDVQATGTEQLILQATYEALLRYGYAELTITRIGDHFGKTNSLIYQYYDSKDELLVELLRELLAQLQELSVDESRDAREQLIAAVQPKSQASLAIEELVTATLILRAEAPHNAAFGEEFQKLDEAYITHITELIELGITQGHYEPVDKRSVAEYLYSLMTGVDFLTTTTGTQIETEAITAELDYYIQTRLLGTNGHSTRSQ